MQKATPFYTVADTKNYKGGNGSGPVYKLQEELEWLHHGIIYGDEAIFLVIRLDQRRRWMMTLICCAAFFPVSVLALTHFPLFVSFINAWKDLFTTIRIAPPCSLVLRRLNSVKRHLLSKDKGN
ncbi:hypothetical protein ACOSQ2_013121 [Xanthoceras sorbifolium]